MKTDIDPSDYSSEAGAEALADQLRDYWCKRGVAIQTWTERVVAARADNHSPLYCVRSNLAAMVVLR
jgi:hypothetical protein